MNRHLIKNARTGVRKGHQVASPLTLVSAVVVPCCPRCGQRANPRNKSTVCAHCHKQVVAEAQQAQERDYLCNWLHTRDELQDALTRHLRAKAHQAHLDWSTPRPPLVFTQRLAQALAPYAPAQAA